MFLVYRGGWSAKRDRLRLCSSLLSGSSQDINLVPDLGKSAFRLLIQALAPFCRFLKGKGAEINEKTDCKG